MELFLTLKLNSGKTELFEIELFICIKMYLALNKLQTLICQNPKKLNTLVWQTQLLTRQLKITL